MNQVTWWRARVGSNNANSGGTVYLINRITPHENFVATTLANDVAVVRTNLALAFQPNLVAAANIAGAAYTYGDRQMVWAVGWGVSSVSQKHILHFFLACLMAINIES